MSETFRPVFVKQGLRQSDKVGYFPDAFGNAGQMPQLLTRAGMEAVAFWPRRKAGWFNNELKEGGSTNPLILTMQWQSPDGTKLLGILFATGTATAWKSRWMKKKQKAYWDERLAKAEMFASTDELLFMNGCDHQPVQGIFPQRLKPRADCIPILSSCILTSKIMSRKVQAEAGEKLSTVKAS